MSYVVAKARKDFLFAKAFTFYKQYHTNGVEYQILFGDLETLKGGFLPPAETEEYNTLVAQCKILYKEQQAAERAAWRAKQHQKYSSGL